MACITRIPSLSIWGGDPCSLNHLLILVPNRMLYAMLSPDNFVPAKNHFCLSTKSFPRLEYIFKCIQKKVVAWSWGDERREQEMGRDCLMGRHIFRDDKKVLKLDYSFNYSECQWIVYIKRVNFMVCKLYLHKGVKCLRLRDHLFRRRARNMWATLGGGSSACFPADAEIKNRV